MEDIVANYRGFYKKCEKNDMTKALTIPAQQYIHLPSIGDISKAEASIAMLDNTLKELLDDQEIVGYQLILITNRDNIKSHFIETDYTSVTNGKFPFAYVFIQPNDRYEQLEGIAAKLGLQVL
jgi:hypothetical protein